MLSTCTFLRVVSYGERALVSEQAEDVLAKIGVDLFPIFR